MKENLLNFIDVETTGLDPYRHEVIEIALVQVKERVSEGSNLSYETLREWEARMTPQEIGKADPVALDIIGYSEDTWRATYEMVDALVEFKKLVAEIDDEHGSHAFFVGHNICFDVVFMGEMYRRAGIQSPMSARIIDTCSAARVMLRGKPEKFSLAKLCEYYGIKNEKTHSALPDVRATAELYKKLMAETDQ